MCLIVISCVSIARAQVSDGGTYTCVASNRAGVDNRYYNLEVHGESLLQVLWNTRF